MLLFCLFIVELLLLYLQSRLFTRDLAKIVGIGTRNAKLTVYLLSLFYLPGTILHEYAHYLVAILLRVPVYGVSFKPQRSGDKLKLGSVTIGQTDPLRKALIGMAPLLFGLFFFCVPFQYLLSVSDANKLVVYGLLGLLTVQITSTMFSSKQDLTGTGFFFFALAVVVGILWLFGQPLLMALDAYAQKILPSTLLSLGLVLLVNLFIFGLLRLLLRLLR